MSDKELIKNILFIDIETVSNHASYEELNERLRVQWDKKAGYLSQDGDTPKDLFFEKAAIYAEFGKVVTIAIGFFHESENGEQGLRVKAIANHDEKELLIEFKELIEQKFDQSKLKFCAHNGKEFDYPYLCRRMLINGISLPQTLDISNRKPWDIPHLDTLEMWKFGDRKNFTSLELLTAIFGIESSKGFLDGSQVNSTYYLENDLEKIALYCMHDVVATAQLYLKFQCRDLIPEEQISFL